jgi:hypothetical protein
LGGGRFSGDRMEALLDRVLLQHEIEELLSFVLCVCESMIARYGGDQRTGKNLQAGQGVGREEGKRVGFIRVDVDARVSAAKAESLNLCLLEA